jgi:hypothetical protein
MKSLFVVSAALGLLLSAQSQLAQAQSISITTTGGCTISGITALTSTGANTFQAAGGTPSGTCTASGGGAGNIVVTLTATPNTITLGSSSLTSTINMSATGAVNCTVRDTTGALSLASPAMSGTSGSTVATAIGSTAGSDTVTGTCTDASGAGATVTVISTSVALSSNIVVVNPNCTGSEQSDTSYALTRTCSGQVGYNDYAPAYSGNVFNFSDVFGAWPAAAAYLGKTAIIPLAKNQFVALQLSPTNSGTINLVANPSYGSSAISVSTTPGGFTFGGSKGTVCSSMRGGSSGVVISNNGSAADCQLNPSLTYYINMGYVGQTTTSPTGSTCTRSTTCYASFTLYKLN